MGEISEARLEFEFEKLNSRLQMKPFYNFSISEAGETTKTHCKNFLKNLTIPFGNNVFYKLITAAPIRIDTQWNFMQ